jgi:predicted AAA+ superfamily ATPase
MPDEQSKKDYLNDLMTTYAMKDVYDAGIKKPYVYLDLMRLLAAQTGKLVNMNELANII